MKGHPLVNTQIVFFAHLLYLKSQYFGERISLQTNISSLPYSRQINQVIMAAGIARGF